MAFEAYTKLANETAGKLDITSQLRATIALSDIFRSSLGPSGFAKLIFDREKNHLVTTTDGYTLVKEIGDITTAAVPKRLLKLAETQYNLAGDFTKTTICLAGAWLQHFLDADFSLRQRKVVLLGFHRAVQFLIEKLTITAFDLIALPGLSPVEYFKQNLLQNLSSKLNPKSALHFANILAPCIIEWQKIMPQRALISSREVLPKVFQTVVHPGGHIADSFLFKGVVFKKEVDATEKMIDLKEAGILLTQEKLYVEKPDKKNAEILIQKPADIVKFREREQIFQPSLPEALAHLGVTVLVSEKGVAPMLIEKLQGRGIFVIRRAKLKQMSRLSEAAKTPILGRTLDAKPDEVITSTHVYSVKIRDEWRVFVELPYSNVFSLIIRCSDYDVGLEIRRVIKSALRAALCCIHAGKILPGAGAWQALATNICTHAPNFSPQVQDAVAHGFKSLINALGMNMGFDPLDISLDLLAKNRPSGNPFMGINAKNGKITPVSEMGIYDSLRGVVLAIDHARQFVEQVLQVTEIYYIDRKPQRS